MKIRHPSLAMGLLLMTASPAALAQPPADGAVALPPILVTGTKREQDPMRLDAMLQSVEAAELAERNIRSLDGLDRVFPDLHIRPRSGRIYTNATIRGQTSADFYNPSVQVLVDGLPQDFALLGQLLPTQIERAELLYGPQGTLYGGGAVGGVIDVVTRRPDDRLRAGGSASASNRQRDTGVLLNVPLVPGHLYGDVSLNWREQSGNYRAPAGNGDFGGTRDIAGQARLRYAPTGSPWDVMLQAGHNVLRSTEEQVVLGEAGLRSRRVIPFDSHYRMRTDQLGLIASYDLGGAVVTSLTGHTEREMDRVLQGFIEPERQRTLSQELRIASRRGASRNVDYTAGLYVQDVSFVRQTPQFFLRNRQDITGYAAYGELTWHLTDRLGLTPGLRLDRYETETRAEGPINFERLRSDTAVSPKIALGYQLSEALRVYGSYTRGFKPGGYVRTVTAFNAALDYGQSRTDSVEMGMHLRTADGRLEASASAYHAYTRGYQAYVGFVPSLYLQNVGDVRSWGFDARVTATPLPGLRLTGALGLNDARFDRYRDPTGAGQDHRGNRPAYVPPVTLNAGLSYAVPLPGGLGTVIPNIAVTHVGRTWFDEANVVGQRAYTLLDAGLGWAVRDDLRADLYANNLTDKRHATYGYASPLGAAYQLGAGREVGLRLTASF